MSAHREENRSERNYLLQLEEKTFRSLFLKSFNHTKFLELLSFFFISAGILLTDNYELVLTYFSSRPNYIQKSTKGHSRYSIKTVKTLIQLLTGNITESK